MFGMEEGGEELIHDSQLPFSYLSSFKYRINMGFNTEVIAKCGIQHLNNHKLWDLRLTKRCLINVSIHKCSLNPSQHLIIPEYSSMYGLITSYTNKKKILYLHF